MTEKVEHPRTYTRHIVDEEENQRELSGTVTLCGLVVSTAPELILGDGDDCGNCKRIAQC